MEQTTVRNKQTKSKGEIAGLYRIKLFIDIYYCLLNDNPSESVDFNSELFDMTSSLNKEETKVYNMYEKALDYIMNTKTNIDLKFKNAKISAYRISMLLMQLERSEFENKHKPILMTQEQYNALSKKEKESKSIAIVQQPPVEYVDENGNYHNPNLDVDLSEEFSEGYHGELVEKDLKILKEELEEMYASIESMRLLADILDMQEIMYFDEPCTREIELVNDVLNSLFKNVTRSNKSQQAKLRAKLRKTFKTIDIEELKPSDENLEEIKKDIVDLPSFIDSIPLVYIAILNLKRKNKGAMTNL